MVCKQCEKPLKRISGKRGRQPMYCSKTCQKAYQKAQRTPSDMVSNNPVLALRIARRLSRRDVCKKTGIHYTTLRNLEQGYVYGMYHHTLHELAAVFDLSYEYLTYLHAQWVYEKTSRKLYQYVFTTYWDVPRALLSAIYVTTAGSYHEACQAFDVSIFRENAVLSREAYIVPAENLPGRDYFLRWIEEQARHTLGDGALHNALCNVHRGMALTVAIQREHGHFQYIDEHGHFLPPCPAPDAPQEEHGGEE